MAGGVIVSVRVTPRAGRDEVAGVDGEGVLRVRVSAAPAGGAATEAVIRLLASALHVPPSSIEVVSGASSRRKRLRIRGMDATGLRERWPGVAPGGTSDT